MKKYMLLLLLAISVAVYAEDKDQTLVIAADVVDGKTCISAISLQGHDNCKQADGKRGACEGIEDCVCSKADKHIEWSSADISSYTVYFYGSSPFKEGCSLDSNSQGKLKCRIKGDTSAGNYDYGIRVDGCADYDPRIVIK